jgi:iron(III) transport system permease protein
VSFPYVFLVVAAAMRALDPSVEEASLTFGRARWTTFARVTLPLLAPALAAGLLLVALYTLSDFGGVATLRYETFTRAIFIEYQTSFDRTAAAILGVALAGVAMVVLIAELLVRARAAERLRASGSRHRSRSPSGGGDGRRWRSSGWWWRPRWACRCSCLRTGW